MSKNNLPVMLFWHTRYKNQRKRYPCRGIVMLSWVGIAKTLTGRGVLDLSPPPLDDACSTYIHACSTYIHAQHTYIHAQHTYIHAQHTYMHAQAYICMYLCMYVYVCMYVCMYAKHAGIWKLKKSSFDQALRNASKHLRKQRFGHTFWSRQDSGFLGSNC